MENNSDTKTPILYTRLVGEVSDTNVSPIMAKIDEAQSAKHVEEVRLTLTSGGGGLYWAFALYDMIMASQKPVIGVAAGQCSSAAFMILQACTKRISLPNTLFMIHPGHFAVEPKKSHRDFMALVESFKRNQDLFVELSSKRSHVSREEFEKMYEPRKYLTAQEALEMGFIDEVVSPI